MKRQSVFSGSPPRLQRGSILVNAAAGLLIGVILLSVIDLGFVFYFKREYQKSADLAAMAGAQQLRSDSGDPEASAEENADTNLGELAGVAVAECGEWMPNVAAGADRFDESSGCAEANAVRVIITGEAPSFFMGPRNISARAIATLGEPLAAFSVGSRAVRVSTDSAIGPLLNGLGLNLSDTALLSYNGLANVKITPGGLLEELGIPVSADIGVGELNALLAARQLSLGRVLNAIVTVADQSSLVSANATLLGMIAANLVTSTPLNVRLGSESGASGLFAEIIAPDGESNSALKTEVGVFDLITAAVGVATSENALKTNLNLNLLGLASVTTQVGVVEPPSVAIGGLGANGICDSNEVCPTAYTAQVRTFIHVQTSLPPLLAPLLTLNLPIVLDAVTGKGTLQEMCTAGVQDTDGEDRAEIEVESTVAKLCVGQIAPADLFSKNKVCDENLGRMELLNIAGLLRLPNNKINVDALEGGGTVTLREGQTKTTGNELLIGDTVADLVDELTDELFGGPVPTTMPTPSQNHDLATQLFNDTSNLCTANTRACHQQRLAAAKTKLETSAGQSGLLSGLLNGLGNIVKALGGILVGNGCTTGTGLLGLGPVSDGACVTLLEGALSSSSSAAGGGNVSNTLSVLTGILKPVLNALGSSVLTPLLNNVVGVHLGETDVKLTSLSCGGNPRLVE